VATVRLRHEGELRLVAGGQRIQASEFGEVVELARCGDPDALLKDDPVVSDQSVVGSVKLTVPALVIETTTSTMTRMVVLSGKEPTIVRVRMTTVKTCQTK